MNDKKPETTQTEYQQLQKLFKKWDTLSGNLRNSEPRAPILLPDLFMQVDNGCSISDILGQLTGFLYAHKNLMDFYGDVKYLQFLLSYAENDRDFSELTRLMQEVKHAAGFRNLFKGIVHVDVSEWLGHNEDKHFIELLNYLAENSGDWMIVLSVRNSAKRRTDIEAMQATVSMFLRVEVLRFSLPKADHFLAVLKEKLGAYGIRLDPDAETLMTETLKVLRGNKYFGGKFTVGILAQDIVYTIYSRPGVKDDALTAQELSEFGPDSDYVMRTVRKMEMTRRIGFDS